MRYTLTINGVTFRPGQVEWEDAIGQMRSPLPAFDKMRKGKAMVGKIITSLGLVAQIGNYWVIVSEHGTADDIFDFTIVPMRAKVKVTWNREK